MQLTVDSGKLPVGWEVKTIGEVTSIVNGGTPKSDESEYWNGDIFWITPKDMGKLEGVYVSNTSRKISQAGLQKSSAKLIPENSVILSTRAPIGHLAISQVAIATNQGCRGLVPKLDLDTKFLFYFLKLNIQLLNELGTGTTFKELSTNALAGVKIPIPPLPEQKQIVAILDEAFEGIDRAIANTEKNLANSRELFESYLNAIFTQKNNRWKWVSLSEITTDITDGDHQPPPKSQSGIPFITISNIDKQNRKVDFSNTFKVPPEYFEKLKSNRKPRKGDLLYTVTGSYGIPVIVDHDIYFCFQRHIGLIRPNAETNSKCLYYILLSRYLLNQADECATGTAQKTVPLSGLRRFSVPKIPKEQQEIIVTELDALSEKIGCLETIYRQKIAALNELKQSILQKAFTGEITADTPKTAKEEIAA